MEQEQIEKILKNLANDEKHCFAAYDDKNDLCSNEKVSFCDNITEVSLKTENDLLKEELNNYKKLISSLSEVYYSHDKFLCEVGEGEDTPHLINDINGNNFIIIPGNSALRALFCIKLCSLLDNIYRHFDCSEDIDEIHNILKKLEDM